MHLAYRLPSGRPTLGWDTYETSKIIDVSEILPPLGERALHVSAEVMPDAWAGTNSACLLLQVSRTWRRAWRRRRPPLPRARKQAPRLAA